MPATNNSLVWADMLNKLKSMGGVVDAVLGEPAAVQTITAAIIPATGDVPDTVLNAPRERHRVTIRFYHGVLDYGADEREKTLDRLRAEIMEDVFGDFDLGGTIAYALPAEFTWTYGYQTVGTTLFRLLDLTVVYRIDPAAVFVA